MRVAGVRQVGGRTCSLGSRCMLMVVEGHSCRNGISVARSDEKRFLQSYTRVRTRVVLLRKRQRNSELLGNGQSEAYPRFPIRELLPVGPACAIVCTTGNWSLIKLLADTSQRFES